MLSNKRASTHSVFSLKFRKSKGDISGSNSARSSISDASTLVAIPEESKKGKACKYKVCEEDLLDWEDQAWGAPKTNASWSGLFGRRKD